MDIISIGAKTWAIAEGYIPEWGTGEGREMVSHEAFCVLNASAQDAHLEVTVYYADRDPVGPYTMTVPAKRTRHFRFNDLTDPEPIPRNTDYSSVIVSDVPVVIQHTRLDSRQPAHALLSTVAFPD